MIVNALDDAIFDDKSFEFFSVDYEKTTKWKEVNGSERDKRNQVSKA